MAQPLPDDLPTLRRLLRATELGLDFLGRITQRQETRAAICETGARDLNGYMRSIPRLQAIRYGMDRAWGAGGPSLDLISSYMDAQKLGRALAAYNEMLSQEHPQEIEVQTLIAEGRLAEASASVGRRSRELADAMEQVQEPIRQLQRTILRRITEISQERPESRTEKSTKIQRQVATEEPPSRRTGSSPQTAGQRRTPQARNRIGIDGWRAECGRESAPTTSQRELPSFA